MLGIINSGEKVKKTKNAPCPNFTFTIWRQSRTVPERLYDTDISIIVKEEYFDSFMVLQVTNASLEKKPDQQINTCSKSTIQIVNNTC